MDTIGGRGLPAPIGTIPFRFHLYWAGSDPDGAVAGFFFAVTETTAIPSPGEGLPAIPGPKPSDYRFTTKTDSVFTFNVIEGRPDRQHGFFIYAVDNEGKVDASPARFIFNSLDRSPPIPHITRAEARGLVYTIAPGGVVTPVQYIRGPSWQPGMAGSPRNLDDISDPRTVPRDTVPSGSSLYFEWTSSIQSFGSTIQKYRYKLTGVDFTDLPPESTSKFFGAGTIPAGLNTFILRVMDEANGSTDSTRRFVLNLSPDTWFAGPDVNCMSQPGSGWTLAPPSPGVPPYWYYPMNGQVGGVGILPSTDIPCTYYGPSNNPGNPKNWVNVLYADRPEKRGFIEWWEDTLYARSEGDTVHLNSMVIFPAGGLDFDSPHFPLVPASPPPGVIPIGPNTTRGPANGSPVGFSGLVVVAQDPNRKGFLRPAESLTYPDFRLGTPYYNPVPVLQEIARSSGYAYSRIRAADGDGSKDNRVPQPVLLADEVDAGGGDAYQRFLRSKVLTFYVNKNPRLLESDPTFVPKIGQTFTTNPVPFNIVSINDDPANIGENTPPGRKGNNNVIRTSVTVCGDSLGHPVCRLDTRPIGARLGFPATITIPNDWTRGTINVIIEVCDCQQCEDVVGQGRCYTRPPIPINWQAPGPSSLELAPSSGGSKP